MPRDDVAMQSQQYALAARQPQEQAQDRMNRSLEFFHNSLYAQQQSFLQGRQFAQQLAQRQAEFQQQQLMDAETLATDQVRRSQAIEELQWARELHTTGVAAAQRRAVTAAAALQEAQAQKAINDLQDQSEYSVAPDMQDYTTIRGRIKEKGVWRSSTDEEKKAAQARIDQPYNRAIEVAKIGATSRENVAEINSIAKQMMAAMQERIAEARNATALDKQQMIADMRRELLDVLNASRERVNAATNQSNENRTQTITDTQRAIADQKNETDIYAIEENATPKKLGIALVNMRKAMEALELRAPTDPDAARELRKMQRSVDAVLKRLTGGDLGTEAGQSARDKQMEDLLRELGK